MNFIKKWMAVLAASVMGALFAIVAQASDPDLPIWDIEVSSTLPTSEYGDYDAWNLVDYDNTTAWVENIAGDGYGEWIKFTLPEGAVVTGIMIKTGYCKSEDIFWKNSAPASISYMANGTEQYINLDAYAYDYYSALNGYYFDITPVATSGSITFQIQNVRGGSKYTDTCISELHVKGYVAESEMGEISWNDTNGSDNYGWEEEGILPDDITEQLMWRLAGELGWIYRKHIGNYVTDAFISEEDLSAEEKAFLVYWYQYHAMDDPRIQGELQYNYAKQEDIRGIIEELFGSFDEETMGYFVSSYAEWTAADQLRMNGSGDFGDAGPFIFDEPQIRVEGDLLRLDGDIKVYESNAGYHFKTKYTGWFSLEPQGAGDNRVFQWLEVGDQAGSYASDESDFEVGWYDDSQEKDTYTLDELSVMALDYIESYAGFRPQYCDAVMTENGMISLHLYSIVDDHTATAAWYEVNEFGIGSDVMFGEEVDLNP